MGRFRHLIKNRNFSFLWIGQIISQFGDRLNQMALLALVYKVAPGSTTQIAKLMAFTILPVFLVGPVAGVYVDRWDRRRTMIVSDLVRGFLVLLIPAFFIRFPTVVPIYIIVFIMFSVGRFYVPAKMAIIPDLVKAEDLLLANSLVNVTGMIAAMIGLGLGGILVSWVGAEGGFLIDGSTFLISGILIFAFNTRAMRQLKKERVLDVGKDIAQVIRKSVVGEMKEAVAFLFGQKQLRFCFGTLFVLWLVLGAMYVVSIVFVQQAFASVTKEVGLLVVGLGSGMFLGTVVHGRLGQKLSGLRTIFICIFFGGVILLAFVTTVMQAPVLSTALALSFLMGLVISPVMVISNTLVHQLTDHAMRGKVFSSLEVVIHAAFLVAMMISAPLADRYGAGFILSFLSWILMGSATIGLVISYVRVKRT